ncbi:succinylarginine dihydrolase [Rhizobium azibense]|uniref:Succinylarginine dihydrolase n=2 Tax=Rhizobium TaxID=379 RepID=A0A4V6P1D5_9HYPH|nr:succinylarginine dihydrolase [Rhizobium azibense]
MAGECAQGPLGLSGPMSCVFPAIRPDGYRQHALHSSERMWPETNCYIDLWIEVLHTLRLPPEAMLGFTLTQDFEGDQFTFFKVPLEDLEALYGIRVTELAIFDRVEHHVETQIRRGRLCLVEMDSFYMPDTQGTAYHCEHGKTTVAINRLDVAAKRVEYFHNAGYFQLEGEDFDGLFQMHLSESNSPFLPYTEFAKFPETFAGENYIGDVAHRLFKVHFSRRPAENPIRAFAKQFPQQVEAVAERPFGFFHKYAFNTLRQFGANFELAADHLAWLSEGRFAQAEENARRISEVAKSVQFQLARAVTRRKFEPLKAALDPAADAWDAMMTSISDRL